MRDNTRIENSYFHGPVEGDSYSGNLIGYVSDITMINCYSASTSRNRISMGLFMESDDCFFNTDLNGLSYDNYAIGITSEEMRDIATYTDLSLFNLTEAWDFPGYPYDDLGFMDIWSIDPSINDGFPYLSWETFLPVEDSPEETPLPISALQGIYPNPFNPETTIRFSVAQESAGTIEIFNIRGQRVQQFKDFTAGEHEVVWNGTDSVGKSVGSGIYFCRMTAGDRSATQKMLLLK